MTNYCKSVKFLNIQKGCNLEAIPVDRESNASEFERAKILWKWDAGDQKWLGYSQDEEVASALEDYQDESGLIENFTTIRPGEGFWIYNGKDEIKTYRGKAYGLEKVKLHQGWNLVGTGKAIDMESLKDKGASYVWRYADDRWSVWTKDEVKMSDMKFLKLDRLNGGEGFWVYVE